jgi:CheY-like chemotaxis protein
VSEQRPVMVVEDDQDIRDSLRDVLTDAGFEVLEAGSGEEAMAALREGAAPGVILLDLMMPGMDGSRFRAEQLKDPVLAPYPVVVLTADARADEKARVLQADGYLPKPVDLEDLLKMVGRFVRPGRR